MGGTALAVGDISADGHELILRYDLANTRWELLNPRAASLAANTFTGLQRWAKGADVASANALTLGTDGNYFDITGTTSITSIGTLGVGTVVKLHFDGALTLTHHATDLILPGSSNITTAAGDEAEFVEYATGDWRCTNYSYASGGIQIPAGTVIWFAANSPPSGFLKANGAAVSRTTYAALFAVIGTTYGAGDGSTTFNLPNLRGEFVRGLDDGRGVDSGRAIGSAQSESVGPHSHTINQAAAALTSGGGASGVVAGVGYATNNNSGLENRPRNVAMLACIKY